MGRERRSVTGAERVKVQELLLETAQWQLARQEGRQHGVLARVLRQPLEDLSKPQMA